jgi:hypothetical protein
VDFGNYSTLFRTVITLLDQWDQDMLRAVQIEQEVGGLFTESKEKTDKRIELLHSTFLGWLLEDDAMYRKLAMPPRLTRWFGRQVRKAKTTGRLPLLLRRDPRIKRHIIPPFFPMRCQILAKAYQSPDIRKGWVNLNFKLTDEDKHNIAVQLAVFFKDYGLEVSDILPLVVATDGSVARVKIIFIIL